MKRSKHETSQACWEWINEYMATDENDIKRKGGTRSGSQTIAYDHFLEINSAWVDPDFDFGMMFGYKIQKWSKLLTNYVDMNMLDIVKSEVLEKERKKTPNYNLTFKFVNTQTSGHACLLTLTFQRRYSNDNPVLILNIRSSEVTKRLLMDFVLVQRIAEYIYGDKIRCSMKVYIGNMYLSAESFVMYHTHRDLHELLRDSESEISKRVLQIYDKFSKPEALNMAYKVHLRSVKRIHKLPTPSLFAKNLKL